MTLPANQPMRHLTQTPRRLLRWGCLGCLWRALAFGAGLMVVLAAAGYGYEQYASARDRQRYPPSGKLIEVDGHKLHLDCRGAGSPTVILETQATSSALDWGYVQPEIAKFTRVCAYDRAGFGWSELGPAPRTAGRAAQELRALLTAAGEQGPYLLVGASYGGHVVRLFAHNYPDEVTGLVLVDARPEKLFSIPAIRKQADSGLVFYRVIAALSDCGLSRLFVALMPEKMIPAYAVPLYRAHPGSFAMVFQAKLWHAAYAEALAMDVSDEEVAAIPSLGALPLVVIRHGRPMMFGSLPPAEAEAMEQQWQTFQESIARQSTSSQLIVAENSGHGVQGEQPEIIIEAVRNLSGTP